MYIYIYTYVSLSLSLSLSFSYSLFLCIYIYIFIMFMHTYMYDYTIMYKCGALYRCYIYTCGNTHIYIYMYRFLHITCYTCEHIYIYRHTYILRTLMRHSRNSMFFETWVLWGDAGFSALFASGRLGWLLLGWILALAGTVFVPPGWILALARIVFASGATFWVLRVVLGWAAVSLGSQGSVWTNI